MINECIKSNRESSLFVIEKTIQAEGLDNFFQNKEEKSARVG